MAPVQPRTARGRTLSKRWLRWGAALAVGATAGYAFALMHTPIPWMLGPLFSLAALRIGGVSIEAPPGARHVGQWIIGVALGLYFTPIVMRQVADVWYLPLAAAAFSLVVGYASGAVLARLAGLDLTTSLFASVPGGAMEMSALGERFGARVDKVAAGQSMRMLLVVAIVPAAFTLAGVHGSDAYSMGTSAFDAAGFAKLMGATLVGALAAERVGIPNAFVIGALLVSIPLTAAEIHLSSMPSLVSNAGQVLLGCALGSRFQPDILHGAPRFIGGVVVSVLVSILIASVFGLFLAWVGDQNAATMILGMAPGGVAEMAITAKVLQLGVPLVTAFHVMRLVVLLMLTGPMYERARRFRRGRGE